MFEHRCVLTPASQSTLFRERGNTMAPWLATEDTVNAKAKPTKAGARMVGYGKTR